MTAAPWAWMYKTTVWRARRLHHLSHHPLCEWCKKDGDIVQATVVHHRVPHKGDWNLFLSTDLVSLCKLCHDSRAKSIEAGTEPKKKIDASGWPV